MCEGAGQEIYTISYPPSSPWKTCTACFPRKTQREEAVLDRGTVLNCALLFSQTCQRPVRKPLANEGCSKCHWLLLHAVCLRLPATLVSSDELPRLWHHTGEDKMTPNDWGWDMQQWDFSSSSDPIWPAGSSVPVVLNESTQAVPHWVPFLLSARFCASKRIQSKNKINYNNFAKGTHFSVHFSLSVPWQLSVYFLTVCLSK